MDQPSHGRDPVLDEEELFDFLSDRNAHCNCWKQHSSADPLDPRSGYQDWV